MNIQDVLEGVLETSAAVEIMNELVLATLASSRETVVAERKRLDDIATNRSLKPHEYEDWVTLVQDIAAINRVIDYYGGI